MAGVTSRLRSRPFPLVRYDALMSDPVLVALITGGAAVLSSLPGLILGILRGNRTHKAIGVLTEQTNGITEKLATVTGDKRFAEGKLQQQSDDREREKTE